MHGKNNAIWVPPGIRHRCALVRGEGISHWSCTSFRIAGCLDLCALLETPFVLSSNSGKRIGNINQELAYLSRQSPDLRHVIRRKELGFSMLLAGIEVSRWRSESHSLAIEAQRLASVLSHIEANLSKPLRVAELAKRAELSSPRFYAVFRLATGTSPHAYLQKLGQPPCRTLLLIWIFLSSISDFSEMMLKRMIYPSEESIEAPLHFNRYSLGETPRAFLKTVAKY